MELDEQATEVQPESFRQGLDDTPEPEAPAPEAAPAPAPKPEPEPEAPPVGPDWLYEPEPQPAVDPVPQHPPQPDPMYPPGGPTYPPQPPAYGGNTLEQFVENPDAFIEQRARRMAEQMVAPLFHQMQQVGGVTQQMQASQTSNAAARAEDGIKKAYDAFNKDSSFKANPNLQGRIGSTLKTLYRQGVENARRYGDYTGLGNLAAMGEREINATLAAAKMYEGIGSGASAPMQVGGAVVEGTRAAAKETSVVLTAEQEEFARKIGGNYADKMRAAIAEQHKYDDFEV